MALLDFTTTILMFLSAVFLGFTIGTSGGLPNILCGDGSVQWECR